MDNVISRIIEIDRIADEKVTQAQKDYNQYIEHAKSDAQELEQEMLRQAQKVIDYIESVNKLESEQHSKAAKEKYSAEITKLNDYYTLEHQKIENDIFSEIVGEVM